MAKLNGVHFIIHERNTQQNILVSVESKFTVAQLSHMTNLWENVKKFENGFHQPGIIQ